MTKKNKILFRAVAAFVVYVFCIGCIVFLCRSMTCNNCTAELEQPIIEQAQNIAKKSDNDRYDCYVDKRNDKQHICYDTYNNNAKYICRIESIDDVGGEYLACHLVDDKQTCNRHSTDTHYHGAGRWSSNRGSSILNTGFSTGFSTGF